MTKAALFSRFRLVRPLLTFFDGDCESQHMSAIRSQHENSSRLVGADSHGTRENHAPAVDSRARTASESLPRPRPPLRPGSRSQSRSTRLAKGRVPFLGDDTHYQSSNPWYAVRFANPVAPMSRKALEKLLLPPGSDFESVPRKWNGAGDCLEVGGEAAFGVTAPFSTFRSWFRARVDNAHRRWPVVAVGFQDAFGIAGRELHELQALLSPDHDQTAAQLHVANEPVPPSGRNDHHQG